MKEQDFTYKEYEIEASPQSKLGDSEKVFFRVLKDGETEFIHWQIMTGTESRSGDKEVIVKKLIADGLSYIHSLLDNGEYIKNGEYKSFSRK